MGGFTVEVNKAVDEDLKKKIGPLAFWVGGVKAAKDLNRFTATVNGRKFEECVALGVGSGKTCGGGIEVWPEADPGDGLLDVCILPAASLLEAAKLTAKVRKGDHDDLEAVEAFTAAEVILEADPAIEMNLDGELVDLYTPVSFRLRGQTHFMVP
jgi:diacylglycerol kinase family enzyme